MLRTGFMPTPIKNKQLLDLRRRPFAQHGAWIRASRTSRTARRTSGAPTEVNDASLGNSHLAWRAKLWNSGLTQGWSLVCSFCILMSTRSCKGPTVEAVPSPGLLPAYSSVSRVCCSGAYTLVWRGDLFQSLRMSPREPARLHAVLAYTWASAVC